MRQLMFINHLNLITMKVPEKVNVRGTGLQGLTASLVKQSGKVAMYLRNDGYYETGIIMSYKQDYTFPSGSSVKKGDFYYWSNEDFGINAKTTKDRAMAEDHFKFFLK